MWKSVSEFHANFVTNFSCQLPPITQAARGGDLDKVKELVKKKTDVNVKHCLSGVRIPDNSSCKTLLLISVLGRFSLKQ